ncbi:hypothetical protein K8I85_00090 [bacterium]|nr:hypothetical protein [bacterium]
MAHSPRMRPQFELAVGDDGPAVLERMRERLASPDEAYVGQVGGRFAYVRLPDERRSLLSPHLHLDLRETERGHVLHGRFSPRPNVWTGFMALFFALALAGTGGLVYGLAQLAVDGPTWTIWFAPASLALIAFVYGAAFIGQGLSNDEMYELRSFVDGLVREVRGIA